MNKDMEYRSDLVVEGNILGKNGIRYNLKVNGNIDAWDMYAGNIIAKDINVGDIHAKDIIAENIDAWDIDAWNISYYAFCFAYHNIKCKSIKSRRENSKHFVLDGKIEIVK